MVGMGFVISPFNDVKHWLKDFGEDLSRPFADCPSKSNLPRAVFDRVDRSFLEVVLSAAGFGLHFRSCICLLYASPGIMMKVNGVKSEPFTLTRSIRQGCPLSPMQYILALPPFLRKLKLRAGELRHATDRHIASVTLPDRQRRTTNEAICKEFRQDLQLEKKWSEVLEKVGAAIELWLRRGLSLKGRLVYLLPGRLPTFSASNPVYHPIQVGKDPIPVHLGERGSFGATGDLSLSPVQRQCRCAECRDAAPYFAS